MLLKSLDLTDHESKSGQYLLRRTEFHGQVESQTSALVARRLKEDEGIPQARLVHGMFQPSSDYQFEAHNR